MKSFTTQKTAVDLTDTADKLFNQLKDGFSKIGGTVKNSTEKYLNTDVKNMFDVLPIIDKAGFRTNRLIVGASIPPSIDIHFSRFKEIDEQEIENLCEEYKKNKMLTMILKTLVTTNNLQSKLSSDNLIFSEICLQVSIPPKISIKYVNKDIAKINPIEVDFM